MAPQVLQLYQLILGQQLAHRAVQADFPGNGCRHGLAVSREHGGFFDTKRTERTDGGFCILLRSIPQEDYALINAVSRDIDHGRVCGGSGDFRQIDIFLC